MKSAARPQFSALRFAGLVTVAGLAVSAFLVAGSYFFWQTEKRSDVTSLDELRNLRARLDTLKRERDDLQGSEETYMSLVAGGAFVPERRLDLIEAMSFLKRRYQLSNLEYEVFPQRPLKLAVGGNYAAVQVMSSRVKIRAEALHDGDLVAFLEAFPRIQRGFFPLDRCTLRRGTAGASAEASPEPPAAAREPASVASPSASISADCTGEWITLVDTRQPRIAPPVASPKAPAVIAPAKAATREEARRPG